MNHQKKAMLVVSFGTSYEETRNKTIGAIETELATAFPAWEVRRAFTSGMILKVLKQRDGIHVDNVPEAMESLAADGIKTLLVQPTHIINGEEYEKMLAQIQPYRDQFDQIRIGHPLITSSEDFEKVVRAVGDSFSAMGKDDALVLMGHGTGHPADAVYAALDYRFKDLGYENVFVGTVEGYPGLEQIKKMVQSHGGNHVTLMPFMVVAGDHATNDMAGDGEDSWKKEFLKEGYEVECILKGLGEFSAIRRIYVEHAAKALKSQQEKKG